MTPIRLGADRIGRTFGPVTALDGVSFAARPQTIHALLGENGAGKTTLIRCLSGLDAPDSGSVVVNGEPVQFKGPRDAFAAGIAVVQQELALSPHLTLLENLVLGMEPTRAGRIDWRAARTRAVEIATSIGATIPWQRQAGDVEIGTLQQLEIIRSIFRGADTLILDEPSAVLAPSQIEGLLRLLTRLRDAGNTIVIITHKLEEALAVADDVTVLRGGTVVSSGPAIGLDRPSLSRLIVGDDINQVRAARTTVVGDPVLRASAVTTPGRHQVVGPVDFEVCAGEILGIAGVAGNGQEDLIEAVVGLRSVATGEINIEGRNVTALPVADRRASGMSYISPDRRSEGLSIDQPLVDNVIIGRHRHSPIARWGWLSPTRARQATEEVLTRFHVRHGSVTDPASSLSGGNQQKVVFGRELSLSPQVLIAAQPTRGVDIRGNHDLHEALIAERDKGCAIVLMSQELDELMTLSDRVLVMCHGLVTGVFDPDEPDAKAHIGQAMLGQASETALDSELSL